MALNGVRLGTKVTIHFIHSIHQNTAVPFCCACVILPPSERLLERLLRSVPFLLCICTTKAHNKGMDGLTLVLLSSDGFPS